MTAIVRPLSSHNEYEAAVVLQEKIWGADVRETVPACLLQIAGEVGGVAVGAFAPDGRLVGFVFGLTGPRDGRLSHWSHILAVDVSWRDRGVGRLLKEHQRANMLQLGVESMFWTFDPLVSRNAHLNLNKLGACVVEYVPDYYGIDPVAKTDTVIGTDRFVIRWDLAEQSREASQQGPAPIDIPCVTSRPEASGQGPTELPLFVDEPLVRIEVPAGIQDLKSTDPQGAAAWRETTRRAFLHYLTRSYRVLEFRPDPQGGVGCYILKAS